MIFSMDAEWDICPEAVRRKSTLLHQGLTKHDVVIHQFFCLELLAALQFQVPSVLDNVSK